MSNSEKGDDRVMPQGARKVISAQNGEIYAQRRAERQEPSLPGTAQTPVLSRLNPHILVKTVKKRRS